MKKISIKRKLGVFILVMIMLMTAMEPDVVALAASQTKNNYPIVLVNGFSGWGRDEMLGYKYWGGFADLEQAMTNSGYTTYTGTVSPFSSNWDRTCELYAYILGGTVDYGEAHSKKYGHARYGRTFDGIYKDWGKNADDRINKIHLVGHSMGGQTVRMLVQLLEQGSEEERAATPDNLNPLFEGGKSWVQSVTTIATPNDGTTLADQGKIIESAKTMLFLTAATAGLGEEFVFDFKLEQWGIKKNPGESNVSYVDRVWNSSIWTDTKDLSTWDLSTDGAQEQNAWVKTQPDVYYFSWATCATHKSLFSNRQLPNLTINPTFAPFATLMGSYTRNDPNRPIIDAAWFASDGVVNTISQIGPKLGSQDRIINYTGAPQLGTWNYMGLLDNTDHLNCTGQLRIVNSFYTDLAAQLGMLQTN